MKRLAIAIALAACSSTEDVASVTSQPLTLDAGEALIIAEAGAHFGMTGTHIAHANVAAASGQPAELSIARSTDYPMGNSTLVLGDNFHYWTTVTGQVAALTTTAQANGSPSGWYFLVRGDGIQASQSSKFEIADNLAGGYAWELEPHITGTTSQKYGDRVEQATIDLERATTTLQVRSVATVLAEMTPTLSNGQTALLVRRNTDGTCTLARVEQGPADSCGTGFRCLRVGN